MIWTKRPQEKKEQQYENPEDGTLLHIPIRTSSGYKLGYYDIQSGNWYDDKDNQIDEEVYWLDENSKSDDEEKLAGLIDTIEEIQKDEFAGTDDIGRAVLDHLDMWL